jgi:hypothetical protein
VLIFPELSNTYVAMSIPECQWCKSRWTMHATKRICYKDFST